MKTKKDTGKKANAKNTAKNTAKGAAKDARRPLGTAVLEMIETLSLMETDLTGVFGPRPELTAAQRRRLLGSGTRRYGFIDKTFDITETNMQYAPGTFDRGNFKSWLEAIEALRNLRVAALQLLDDIDDRLIQSGDNAFRMALIYYNTVRDLARHGDDGAREVFNALRPFFANRASRRAAGGEEGAEPTKKRLERDVKAVLDGRRDGIVAVAGQRARTAPRALAAEDETAKA